MENLSPCMKEFVELVVCGWINKQWTRELFSVSNSLKTGFL